MGIASNENFVDLANAIIAAAATDYCMAYKVLRLNPDNRDANWKMEECRRFFRSKWYGKLTTVDGERLMEQLERQVDAQEKQRIYRQRGNANG